MKLLKLVEQAQKLLAKMYKNNIVDYKHYVSLSSRLTAFSYELEQATKEKLDAPSS